VSPSIDYISVFLQSEIISTPFGQIFLLILAGAAVHTLFLVVNFVAVKFICRLPERELKAALIMSSHKTLPVAVTVISYFPESVGPQGLLTIPCIVSHIVQLFIDSFIVAKMASKEENRLAAEKAAEVRSLLCDCLPMRSCMAVSTSLCPPWSGILTLSLHFGIVCFHTCKEWGVMATICAMALQCVLRGCKAAATISTAVAGEAADGGIERFSSQREHCRAACRPSGAGVHACDW
jgi:hypothetical protein